jgi:hypothetical protein
MVNWEGLYSDADDFCRVFEPAWERQQVEAGIQHRVRPSALTVSEGMTLLIAFHPSRFRDFKHYRLRGPLSPRCLPELGEPLAVCRAHV